MAGVPPKKGSAFTFTVALTQQGNTKLFKSNPTLASGDVQVSKDYGTFSNIATLPDAEPDSGSAIRVQLSATEMDADVVTVLFHDAAGDEWCDQLITIHTDTATIGEIEAQTDDIGVAGAGLTAIPTIANVTTVDSTTTIGATGLAAIAAAVWDALRTDHALADTFGAVDEWAGAINPQEIRDAMKLAPSAGAPAPDSIDGLVEARAVPGDAMTLTVGERGSVASAVLAAVVEGTHTVAQYLRGFAAVLLGKSSNRGATYRDVDDTKTRVDATLDDEGNRIAITLDLD